TSLPVPPSKILTLAGPRSLPVMMSAIPSPVISPRATFTAPWYDRIYPRYDRMTTGRHLAYLRSALSRSIGLTTSSPAPRVMTSIVPARVTRSGGSLVRGSGSEPGDEHPGSGPGPGDGCTGGGKVRPAMRVSVTSSPPFAL